MNPIAALFGTALLCAGLAPKPAAAADSLRAVIFDIEPVELPDTPAIRDKLTAETALLRKLFSDKGYTVVDTSPQAKKIADNSPLSQCNGCDQDIAKALGADIEVATAIQAVSSATFNLSGSVKDVKTNRVLREGVVDIRGEQADVWTHGVRFLVKERLLDPPLPATAQALSAAVAAMGKPAN